MNQVSNPPLKPKGESWPAPLRVGATLISYIFHPIFLVPLMAACLIYGAPSLYLGVSPHDKSRMLVSLALNTVLFPLLVVFLSKALGMISSVRMENAKDRIIPYIATLTCYFWAWRLVRFFPNSSAPMVAMIFGVFLTASAGLVLNSFLKISMHAMGVGGLVMFFLLLGWQGLPGAGLALSLSIFIAGLVVSARLIVSTHSRGEILLGLLIGMVGQVLGFAFFH